MEFEDQQNTPWGYYNTLARESKYVVRIITIHAGMRTSLHRHPTRDELWQCVQGTPNVLVCDIPDKLSSLSYVSFAPGDATRVRTNFINRIDNTANDTDAKIIEIQFGECDDEHIERFADDHGRTVHPLPKPLVHQIDEDVVPQIIKKGCVILKFTANWCTPCKLISPAVYKAAANNTHIKFVEADVEVCETLSTHYDVTSMPTFVGLRDGDIIQQFEGASEEKLDNLISSLTNAV